MTKKKLLLTVDLLILFLAVLLSNLRALVFFSLFPDTRLFSGVAWSAIAVWIVALLLVALSLKLSSSAKVFWELWRRNGVIALFLFLAILSVFWAVDLQTTLFRALELFLATLVASYIGLRFTARQLSVLLFWFGAIVLILSLEFVFAFPGAGRMLQPPYDAAWRGIYWHKNHLGSVLALLNIVFLQRTLSAMENRSTYGVLDALLYMLSLITLYFTNSATAYIVAIALHFFLFCVWMWLKFSHYLQKWHYYFFIGLLVLGGVLASANLDAIFGLFNRSSTMTGRVDLWDYLLKDVIVQRPWWGHGFGAIWASESFRVAARQQTGWGFQPVIADNGYLEILLHLGVVGFLIFLSTFILAASRSARHAINQRNLADFVPFLLIYFALWANIALSLFAETEVFVWSLIVLALFMTTPKPVGLITSMDRQ